MNESLDSIPNQESELMIGFIPMEAKEDWREEILPNNYYGDVEEVMRDQISLLITHAQLPSW